MPKIVIAVVPGWAAGGGHSLHVVCDLTLASAEHARFKQTDADVGSFDAGYGSAYLSRMVGQKFAREIFFLGREYTARADARDGCGERGRAARGAGKRCAAMGREINGKSPTAQRMLKYAFNLVDDGLVGQQLFAGEATRLAYGTDEAVEGRDSFLQKRPRTSPPFRGRTDGGDRDAIGWSSRRAAGPVVRPAAGRMTRRAPGAGCARCRCRPATGCWTSSTTSPPRWPAPGDALLPLPAADPPRADRLAVAFGAGDPLTDGEDDADDPTALVVATLRFRRARRRGPCCPAGALRASAAATARRLAGSGAGSPGPDAPPAWLLALPAEHIAGLQVLVRALADGTAPTVLDTARAFSPAGFVEAVARMPGGRRRFVSLVPTQLHRILLDADATAALAGFDAVLVGGAATPPGLVERAAAAGIRVVTTYGMSETCGGCVYDGVPLDGVGVEIQADRPDGGPTASDVPAALRPGRPVGSGSPGRSSPAATAACPATPTSRPAAGGRSAPHDRGVLRGRHAHRCSAGSTTCVVTGGLKVDPLAVERVLSAAPGVAQIVVRRRAATRSGARSSRRWSPATPAGSPDLATSAPLPRPSSARPRRPGTCWWFPSCRRSDPASRIGRRSASSRRTCARRPTGDRVRRPRPARFTRAELGVPRRHGRRPARDPACGCCSSASTPGCGRPR